MVVVVLVNIGFQRSSLASMCVHYESHCEIFAFAFSNNQPFVSILRVVTPIFPLFLLDSSILIHYIWFCPISNLYIEVVQYFIHLFL